MRMVVQHMSVLPDFYMTDTDGDPILRKSKKF